MAERVPYQPSNGTEGEIFYSRWCAFCVRDQAARDGEGFDGCEILARTMALRLEDPDYPKEWVSVDGVPRCSAFDPEGDRIPLDPAAVIRPLL